MNDEIWKGIPGFGNNYEASSLGRVRVKDRVIEKRCFLNSKKGSLVKQNYKGKILHPAKSDYLGHLTVIFGIGGKDCSMSVHRLVLLAFVGEPKDGQVCCHGNGIASDNRIENLRWDSQFENNQDRKKHGTYAQGSKHHMAKLTDEDILEIRKSGMKFGDVAKQYGISKSQAHRICTRQSWAHI